MALPVKIKKLFLLTLLLLVSFVLSVIKFISGGGKTSQAQAQCWTIPITTTDTNPGTTGSWPDACVTTVTTGTTEGGTTGTTACY